MTSIKIFECVAQGGGGKVVYAEAYIEDCRLLEYAGGGASAELKYE